jgi:hypothetical protein
VALDRGGSSYAWLVSGVLLALVLSPLLGPADADSFPWSSYPMFAHGRADAISQVNHLVAFDAEGARRPVPPQLVANDEVLQADATLRRAIRGGRKTRVALCRKVAARVADEPDWADIVRLELLTEKFDALRYFSGDTAPLEPPLLRARCTVPR